MTRSRAACWTLGATFLFCLGACAKEPARNPVAAPAVAKNVAPAVVVDASTAPNDAGLLEIAPREILRVGSTDPTHNAFVVDASRGTWIDIVNDAPHLRHCDFVGEVIGVSANGRVALQEYPSYDLMIVDLPTSCNAVKTSVKSNSQNERWSGSSSTNALSDDGSRVVIGSIEGDHIADIYALPSGKRLFGCATHAPAGGPNAEHGISGDGRSITWTHGRDGTWVEELGKCGDDWSADVATSNSYSALISPHRKFLVTCPFHDWGTDAPHRGFVIASIGKSGTSARLDTRGFADDDFDFCNTHKSAFSSDDALLAFEDGFRVRIYSLASRDQRTQIGETTLAHAMTGEVRALSFAGANNLLVASDRQIVRVDLRAYAAYEHAPLGTIDEEMALRERAFTTVDLDDAN